MTVRKGLGQANILRTNNNTSTGYGIVYADEVSGHRTVANLTALYALHDWQLSASGDNTNSDAIGQLWYVVDADGKGNGALYQLKDWSKRKEAAGWSEFKGTGGEVDLSGYATTSALNEAVSGIDTKLAQKVDTTVAETTYAKTADLNAHKNNKSNPHEVTKAQVGLGNVDNTSDIDKANKAGNPIHEAIAKKVNADHIAGSTLGLIKPGTTSGNTYGVNVNASTGEATVRVDWKDENVYQTFISDSDTHTYRVLGSTETTPITAGKVAKSVYLKGLTFTPEGNVLSVGTGEMKAATFTGDLDGNAKTATSATSATKATNDGDGNNIVNTYLKKTDFNSFKGEFIALTNSDIDNLWNTAPDRLV